MQASAYAKDCHFAHEKQWCEQVWFLNEFLQARKHGSLKQSADVVESLVAYEPWQWRLEYYASTIKEAMKSLNSLLLADLHFIGADWGVQVLWVSLLNHHVEAHCLLCRYVLQGSKEAHKVAFQAQGRVKGTKYAKISHATFRRDRDLLEAYSRD